jgi:sterol desaturase/sphingolipid hydroxylase (fatty acid hydroxylase superfamily)
MKVIMQEYSVRNSSRDTLNAIVRMSRTRANYWAEFAIDGFLGVVLVMEGLRRSDEPAAAILVTILMGLLIFSFMEYVCHRWLFHGTIQLVKEGHASHHRNPLGYDALPFFLPAIVLTGLIGVLTLCLSASHVYLLSGTMAFGYVIYGLSHFLIHHRRFHNALARKWAARHHIHHFHQDCNFGVTTPLWDILLGTSYISKKK